MIDCVYQYGVALWRDRIGDGNYRIATCSIIKSEADIDKFISECAANRFFIKGDLIRITTNNPDEYFDTVIRQVLIREDVN